MKLKERINALGVEARTLVDKARTEDRELSGQERSRVEDILLEGLSLIEGHETANATANDMRAALSVGNGTPLDPKPRGSLGSMYVGSQGYQAAKVKNYHNSAHNVEFAIYRERKPRGDLVTGSSPQHQGEDFLDDDTGGLFVRPDWRGLVAETYRRELRVVDLLTILPTDSDAVEYVRIDNVTNAAAPVAEATHSDDSPAAGSGTKPESAIAFTPVRDLIRTFAHLVPITQKAIDDARQLEVIIDSFLRYGLAEEMEDQVVLGDGVGENFTGLFSAQAVTNGVQVYTPGVGEDRFDAARRARTLSRLAHAGSPTAYLMHPNTWDDYLLSRDNDNRYFGNGPFSMGPDTLWSLPVATAESVPEGEVMTGNFRQGVVWERQGAVIDTTDSHKDWFGRNILAVRAESRAGFGMFVPATFVKFTAPEDS